MSVMRKVLLISLAMISIYLSGLKHTDSYYMKKSLIYLQSYALPYLFCLLCIVSISLLTSNGYTSKFLSLCEYLSYELYLIHGPLLIKHNPIVGNFETRFILIRILLWLGVTLGLAFVLKTGAALSNKLIIQPTH
jgi:peptidoglycan/LPS O-acetylase OafA/YrhL